MNSCRHHGTSINIERSTYLEVQEDELVAWPLEGDGLEGGEHRPEHLPPVADGGRVDEVDKVKQDRIARDESPSIDFQQSKGEERHGDC